MKNFFPVLSISFIVKIETAKREREDNKNQYLIPQMSDTKNLYA
jgi:hypothetical protein